MSKQVIKVENLSKMYRLGEINTGMLSHDLQRFWARMRGKEDPFMTVGVENDRTVNDGSQYTWALKDLNFEINEGDTIGIIGKNGAGKSTLLKILSRVTSPTTGSIKVRGRIASLLEVGTGFHPELTGRENIYLNGAILGMTRKEITAKFDEIVDFSGVEKYIDTPVKRYSSGMYVRLAFAVAAHLEPEILIVDEVLAVGDAEFQKKCLGKMKDVSTHGRTILFVSHNMTAIQSLCKKAVFLKNGTLHSSGECGAVVSQYLSVFADVNVKQVWDINMAPGNNEVKLLKAMVAMPEEKEFFSAGDPVEIEFEYLNLGTGKEEQYGITIHLFDELNNLVFVSGSAAEVTTRQMNGRFYGRARIPENLLHEGTYTIGRLLFVRNRGQVVYEHLDVLTFEVINKNSQLGWMGKKEGVVKPKINWEIQLTND